MMMNGMNLSNLNIGGAGKKLPPGAGKAFKAPGFSGDNGVPNAFGGDASDVNVPGDTDSGVTPFQKIYNEIAQNNKIAQSKNGAKNGTDSDSSTDDSQDAALQALLGPELLQQLGISNGSPIQQILNGSTDADSSGGLSAQGAALISDAIAAITKMLNLKTQGGLENLGSMTPSQGIVDQLAEMLSTLKGIAGVLDESVTQNQPLEYKNLALDVPAAANLQQEIQEQMFKIELGLKMMGISGKVAASMAQNDNSAQALSGIPQASDPSKLAMPAIHINQVLGGDLVSKEQKVETLLTKLAETLKQNGNADASTSAVITKIASSANDDTDKATAPDIKDIGPLDSQILRKILNIDADQNGSQDKNGKQTTASENKNAAQVVASGMKNTAQTVDSEMNDPALATASENKNAAQQNIVLGLPKEGQVVTSKTMADAVVNQKAVDTSTLAISADQNAASQASDKLMTTLRTDAPGTARQLEESVLQQVAEKLNLALKTGVTEIRVQLRPESLGDVQLKIKVDGDVVTGKMYVENQQVKHIVEANLQTLKNSLSQHNLSVGSFSVDVNHGNGADQQMRDLANMGTQDRNGNTNNSNKDTNDTEKSGLSNTFVSGIDTGRKFGTNTIEYFA